MTFHIHKNHGNGLKVQDSNRIPLKAIHKGPKFTVSTVSTVEQRPGGRNYRPSGFDGNSSLPSVLASSKGKSGKELQTSAGSVVAARFADQRTGSGAIPTPALHNILLAPIAHVLARVLIVMWHYLHSMPGGSQLSFGVFLGARLLGALVLGCGPAQAYKLVSGATRDDCMTLTRLWLSDELPTNSESRVIGAMIHALKKNTAVKFLISYADPSAGHIGTIYQAINWTYTGQSEAMPLYDLGDGVARHSRSLSHAFGTHSIKHFNNNGVELKKVPQSGKHRYIYFVDPSWRDRLRVPALPYPKKEV